jgi:hypothetical protein
MLESNFDVDHKRQMLENIRNILAIDDISIVKEKTKEADELSTVSSITTTNFTGKMKVVLLTFMIFHFA